MKKPKEPVNGKRFLTAGELHEWSQGEQHNFWSPTCEVVESDSTVKLIVDMPQCGVDDIQIALLPRVIILKQKVRLLASRSWKQVWRALFGPAELFRRFDVPASSDVNRVKAEMDWGVRRLTGRKQPAVQQPAIDVPSRPHAFAA